MQAPPKRRAAGRVTKTRCRRNLQLGSLNRSAAVADVWLLEWKRPERSSGIDVRQPDALLISSTIFFASARSIIVLSMQKTSLSTPA